jgi:uncharacterized protein YidB (DUF937 family)
MGMFDELLQTVVSNAVGTGGGSSSQLANGLMQLLGSGSQTGGLATLVQGFQQSGLGDIISSWISTGENLPISPAQIQSGLGSGPLQQFASSVGLSPEGASSKLAEILPAIIDRLTPDGQLPQSDLLGKGLNFLKAQL